MRKRELQSFQLKLSDLKEYEAARQELLDSRNQQDNSGLATPITGPAPIVKVGPKTKQDVRERLGFKSWNVRLYQRNTSWQIPIRLRYSNSNYHIFTRNKIAIL